MGILSSQLTLEGMFSSTSVQVDAVANIPPDEASMSEVPAAESEVYRNSDPSGAGHCDADSRVLLAVEALMLDTWALKN